MINVDAVPPALRGSQAFRNQCAAVLRKLQDPMFVRYVCVHEAAHLTFFEMMGPISYRPLKAFLTIDPAQSRFQTCFAAVELLEVPPCLEHRWAEWLAMCADAEAAGGVAGERILPEEPRGDERDRRSFISKCRKIEEHFEDQIRIDAEGSWRKAQERVELRLTESPWLFDKILKRADKIRPEFGFRPVTTCELPIEYSQVGPLNPAFVPSFRLIS